GACSEILDEKELRVRRFFKYTALRRHWRAIHGHSADIRDAGPVSFRLSVTEDRPGSPGGVARARAPGGRPVASQGVTEVRREAMGTGRRPGRGGGRLRSLAFRPDEAGRKRMKP